MFVPACSWWDDLSATHQIQPHKLVGVVGDHSQMVNGEPTGLPIERIVLSNDKSVLCSSSHDSTVKVWDVAYLIESEDSTDNDDEGTRETSVKHETESSEPDAFAAGSSLEALPSASTKRKGRSSLANAAPSLRDPAARKGKKAKKAREKAAAQQSRAAAASFFSDL
eukprot:SAG31_NODE_6126_length_2158_cov_0.930549_2_plen_167_part_00